MIVARYIRRDGTIEEAETFSKRDAKYRIEECLYEIWPHAKYRVQRGWTGALELTNEKRR